MSLKNCNIFMDTIMCIYYSNIASYYLYRNIPIAVDMDMNEYYCVALETAVWAKCRLGWKGARN